MSEDKPAKVASGFLASLLPFIPEPIRFFMGWFLALALLYAFMYAIIFMPTYFRNFAESNVKASEFCWELREIQKTIFRFNKCTGEAIQVEIKARQATPPPKPSAKPK